MAEYKRDFGFTNTLLNLFDNRFTLQEECLQNNTCSESNIRKEPYRTNKNLIHYINNKKYKTCIKQKEEFMHLICK